MSSPSDIPARKATPSPDEAWPNHLSLNVRAALSEARDRLQSTYGDRLRRVVLYGSRARGDATEDSDVDLLVVLDGLIENEYQELKRAGACWSSLLERYELFFSFQVYTEAEYQTQQGPFMRNVHAEGIPLLSPPASVRTQ